MLAQLQEAVLHGNQSSRNLVLDQVSPNSRRSIRDHDHGALPPWQSRVKKEGFRKSHSCRYGGSGPDALLRQWVTDPASLGRVRPGVAFSTRLFISGVVLRISCRYGGPDALLRQWVTDPASLGMVRRGVVSPTSFGFRKESKNFYHLSVASSGLNAGENQLLLILVPQNHGDSCTKSTVHETSVQSHPELADPIRHLLAQVELVWAQNSRADLQNGSLADDQKASKQGQREAQHCPRQEAGNDCPESLPGKKSNQLAPQT